MLNDLCSLTQVPKTAFSLEFPISTFPLRTIIRQSLYFAKLTSPCRAAPRKGEVGQKQGGIVLTPSTRTPPEQPRRSEANFGERPFSAIRRRPNFRPAYGTPHALLKKTAERSTQY